MKSRIRQKSISGMAPVLYLNGRFGTMVFMALAGFLLVVGVFRPNMISDTRTGVTDIMSPVISSIAQPFQNLAQTIGGVSGMAALRAENAQLKSENIRLKEWYQTALMLQAKNQSLQELLNLEVDPAHRYATARVISDAGNAFVKTLITTMGADDGVKKNQAVLAGEGMIGRIIETGQNSSRILLMSDINSRIPIMVEGSSQKAIMVGNNSAYPRLKHLPLDAGLTEGARIVTSGHGGVFPAGLPIGRLVKDNQGRFIVKTYADMNKVSYVRILQTPLNPNLILNSDSR